MNTQIIIISIICAIIVVVFTYFLSIYLKTSKRTKLFEGETEQHTKNKELYELLIEELERTKKISKNEESINLYNSWIEEFDNLNERKILIDGLIEELESFYNDKDHKNFMMSINDLEGKKFHFDDDLKNLFQKVKQYTDYELENTRISLQLKTKIKELNTSFEQKLEFLEIFNRTFFEEIATAQGLIAEFESLQKSGDYPEGREVLKNCNRRINRVEYILKVILDFYEYLTQLDSEITTMHQLSEEIKKIGFSLNISDFTDKLERFSTEKDQIMSVVAQISFEKDTDKQYFKQLEIDINNLDLEIDELNKIVEEKFSYIKEIIKVINENKRLLKVCHELINGAVVEREHIILLYELPEIKQIKIIDDEITQFNKFEEDYHKLLEMTYSAREDFSTLQKRLNQSNKYLIHLIKNIQKILFELKSIRNDEIVAVENISNYIQLRLEIDLYLRKHAHKYKMSNEIKALLLELDTKLHQLDKELKQEPLKIKSVRKLDYSIRKNLDTLISVELQKDVRQRKGSLLLLNYCAKYNQSDELNLTLKNMYVTYKQHDYRKVIRQSKELLIMMDPNGAQKFELIVNRVKAAEFVTDLVLLDGDQC